MTDPAPTNRAASGKSEVVKFRLDAESLARLDEVKGSATRSALLRQLVSVALEQLHPQGDVDEEIPEGRHRLYVSLSADELAHVAREAKANGMTRPMWLRTLIRRRLGIKGMDNSETAKRIAGLGMLLRRIGNNVNQAVKAIHLARQAIEAGEQGDKRHIFDIEIKRIERALDEVEAVEDQFAEAMQADYRYWMAA